METQKNIYAVGLLKRERDAYYGRIGMELPHTTTKNAMSTTARRTGCEAVVGSQRMEHILNVTAFTTIINHIFSDCSLIIITEEKQ